MHVTYTNNIADLVAFSDHVHATSPGLRRTFLVLRIALSLGITCLLLLEALNGKSAAVVVPIAVAGGVALWFLFPLVRRAATRLTFRALETRESANLKAEHAIELLPTGIRERTATGEQTTAWSGVLRLDETPHHLFIMLGPATGHVVPRDRLREGDFAAFTTALRDGLSANGSSRPSDPG